MEGRKLKELIADPNFIPGIYNYCDRWCERCPFCSRCSLYATLEASAVAEDPDIRDLNNAKFWRNLETVFKDAHDLIRECAKEAGIDLDEIGLDEAPATHDAETQNAQRHELSVLARDYAGMVEDW